MAQVPSYHDLQADGATLRIRLADLDVSLDSIVELLHAVRGWQSRCRDGVAVRSPRHSAEFRVETGPLQRLVGDDWMPTPGWQDRLDDSLLAWLRALERIRGLGSGGR
jgi:hypothetical protein